MCTRALGAVVGHKLGRGCLLLLPAQLLGGGQSDAHLGLGHRCGHATCDACRELASPRRQGRGPRGKRRAQAMGGPRNRMGRLQPTIYPAPMLYSECYRPSRNVPCVHGLGRNRRRGRTLIGSRSAVVDPYGLPTARLQCDRRGYGSRFGQCVQRALFRLNPVWFFLLI